MTYKDNSVSRETECTQLSNGSLDLGVAVTPKILWGCILRNDAVLTEVVNDVLATSCEQTSVQQHGKELLDHKRTPGFEYRLGELHCSNNPSRMLKGMKYHVYEHIRDMAGSSPDATMRCITWAFALVFDAHHTTREEALRCINRMVSSTKCFQHSEIPGHSLSNDMLETSETMKLTLTQAVRQHMWDINSLDTGTSRLQDKAKLTKKASRMKKLMGLFQRKKIST